MESIPVRADGGCTPRPPQTISGGQGLSSYPDTVPIAVLGFAAMARVNYSEPPGAYEIMESISVRADGGVAPPDPPQTISCGQGLSSYPDTVPIAVLGFAAMARVNYSEPPGAYEIMESISVRADGGLHPPTPCRRCHVGRVERGTEGFDLHSPNTVLSPFWCSPQRGRSPSTRRVAGIALRCPWECLR